MHISYMWAGDMYGSRMRFPLLKPEAWWLVPIEMSSDQAWSLMIGIYWGFLRSLKLDDCFLVVSMVNNHTRKKKGCGMEGKMGKVVHFPSHSATAIICIICLLQFNEVSKCKSNGLLVNYLIVYYHHIMPWPLGLLETYTKNCRTWSSNGKIWTRSFIIV